MKEHLRKRHHDFRAIRLYRPDIEELLALLKKSAGIEAELFHDSNKVQEIDDFVKRTGGTSNELVVRCTAGSFLLTIAPKKGVTVEVDKTVILPNQLAYVDDYLKSKVRAWPFTLMRRSLISFQFKHEYTKQTFPHRVVYPALFVACLGLVFGFVGSLLPRWLTSDNRVDVLERRLTELEAEQKRGFSATADALTELKATQANQDEAIVKKPDENRPHAIAK